MCSCGARVTAPLAAGAAWVVGASPTAAAGGAGCCRPNQKPKPPSASAAASASSNHPARFKAFVLRSTAPDYRSREREEQHRGGDARRARRYAIGEARAEPEHRRMRQARGRLGAEPGRERVVRERRDRDARGDRERLPVTRREQQREELGLVPDLRDGDGEKGDEECGHPPRITWPAGSPATR